MVNSNAGSTDAATLKQPTVVIAATLIAIALVVCFLAGRAFISAALEQPTEITACSDRSGTHFRQTNETAYFACVDTQAKRFLEGDYAESKDLAKAFLTLLTAVFVASITFSEKIVNVAQAGWWPRGMMITAWSLFLTAIVACGCGLAFITLGAGVATYQPEMNYWMYEARAVPMFGVAGLAFGGGLVALLVAGIISMVDLHARAELGPFVSNPSDMKRERTDLPPTQIVPSPPHEEGSHDAAGNRAG